jgi:hypothetical protein
MSIQDLMAAAAKAQAAKTADAAAVSGVAKTDIAVAAAAAAGGAGEGAVKINEPDAAAVAAAKGKEGAEAGSDVGKGADAAAVAAAAAPDLTALVEKVTNVSIANAKLEAEVTALTLNCAAMVTVVSDSLDRMSIALGGGKVDVSKMSVEALVAQHASAAATFAAKFPVGGVAAVPTDSQTNQEAQVRDREALAIHTMRVAAAAGGTAAKK